MGEEQLGPRKGVGLVAAVTTKSEPPFRTQSHGACSAVYADVCRAVPSNLLAQVRVDHSVLWRIQCSHVQRREWRNQCSCMQRRPPQLLPLQDAGLARGVIRFDRYQYRVIMALVPV